MRRGVVFHRHCAGCLGPVAGRGTDKIDDVVVAAVFGDGEGRGGFAMGEDASLRIGSGLQQDAGAFDIAVQDRQMQCRSLVVVGALHRGQVGTTPDHNCDSGDIALFGGGEEPRCLG